MKDLINRKFATAILYQYLTHGADLLQARGLKRFFEYHAMRHHKDVMDMMRKMASHRWEAAFPDLQDAMNTLQEYRVDTFYKLKPNKVSNETYSATIRNIIESCIEHESKLKGLIQECFRTAPVEDHKMLQRFARESEDFCKELKKKFTHYDKYGWQSSSIESDQLRMNDKYKDRLYNTPYSSEDYENEEDEDEDDENPENYYASYARGRGGRGRGMGSRGGMSGGTSTGSRDMGVRHGSYDHEDDGRMEAPVPYEQPVPKRKRYYR